MEFGSDHTGITQTHKAKYECKVQVKSTWSEGGNREINLHKLKLLAVNKSPSFIVFQVFKNNEEENIPELEKVFVTHLDKELTDRIINISAEKIDVGIKLNKCTLTIDVKERTELVSPYGIDLKKYMSECIVDQDDYIKDKIVALENSGYDKNKTGKVKFSVKYPAKAVEDALFGRNDIEVDNVVITPPDRYGVKSETITIDKDAIFALRSTSEKTLDGYVVFSPGKLGSEIRFSTQLHLPAINSMVEEKFRRVRIEADLFDILLGSTEEENNLDLKINTDKQTTFYEIKRTLELLDKLWNTNNPITMRMEYPNVNIPDATISPNEIENILVDEIELARDLHKHVSARVTMDMVQVSINDLERQHRLLKGLTDTIKMSGQLYDMVIQLPDGDVPTDKTKGVGLNIGGSPIGDKVLVCFLSNSCDNISYNDQHRVYVFPETALVVESVFLIDDLSDEKKAELKNYAEELSIELSGNEERFVFQDFRLIENK